MPGNQLPGRLVRRIRYIPFIIFVGFVSKGHHDAHTYPERPWSMLRRKDHPDQLYRVRKAEELALFLHQECKLPCTSAAHIAGSEKDYRRIANAGQRKGGGPASKLFDVFLAQAGGDDAVEAQIVAHALIDHGIDSKEDLLWLVHTEPDWLKAMPGIALTAAIRITQLCSARKIVPVRSR